MPVQALLIDQHGPAANLRVRASAYARVAGGAPPKVVLVPDARLS